MGEWLVSTPALRDGFIRSAAFKHGLLRERTHDAPVYAGINTPS